MGVTSFCSPAPATTTVVRTATSFGRATTTVGRAAATLGPCNCKNMRCTTHSTQLVLAMVIVHTTRHVVNANSTWQASINKANVMRSDVVLLETHMA